MEPNPSTLDSAQIILALQDLQNKMQVLSNQVQNNQQQPNPAVQELQAQVQALSAQVQNGQANQQRSDSSMYRPRLSDMRPFTGNPKDLDIERWLFRTSQYLQKFNVDEKEWIPCATEKLEGIAAMWWEYTYTQGKIPANWQEFCTLIKSHFESSHAQLARDTFYTITQTGSIHEYTRKFREVLMACPEIHEADRTYKYIKGLNNDYRIYVQIGKPKTFEEAACLAESLMIDKPRQQMFSATRSIPTPTTDAMELDHIRRQRLSKLSDSERDKLRQTGACFRCRMRGHIARNCPQRQNPQSRTYAIAEETQENLNPTFTVEGGNFTPQ